VIREQWAVIREQRAVGSDQRTEFREKMMEFEKSLILELSCKNKEVYLLPHTERTVL